MGGRRDFFEMLVSCRCLRKVERSQKLKTEKTGISIFFYLILFFEVGEQHDKDPHTTSVQGATSTVQYSLAPRSQRPASVPIWLEPRVLRV